MARPLRPNIPGAIYHAMARGNRRRPIYLDDADREQFLRLLARTCRRFGWQCLAYCLMENHYHLVVRTPLPNLSRGMMSLNGGYAAAFNGRRDLPGHLFQGRFRSVLVRNSEHLLTAMKYVLRNPATSGLCDSPENWPWSSFNETVARASAVVAVESTLAWFGGDEKAAQRFAEFMRNDQGALLDGHPVEHFPVDPGERSTAAPLEEILAADPGAAGIARAYRDHGYSLGEIAVALGRSRSVVGRQLVAYEAAEMLDRAA